MESGKSYSRVPDSGVWHLLREKEMTLNYNFHQSLQDKCHRFLNALEPGTQIPVHHHPTKAETFVILKGKVRVTTYNDAGEIMETCVISQENGTYGVDIPKNVWHGVECLEPSILLECKEGRLVEHEVDGSRERKKASLGSTNKDSDR